MIMCVCLESGILIGSLERIFRRVLHNNAQEIGKKFLCPVCKSMANPRSEIKALDSFFDEIRKLEKSPLSLKVPNNLRAFGFYEGNVTVEAFKTHSRTAKFEVSENDERIGAETSDIVFLVMHEYISPNAKIPVDEKISFFQAKIEKNDRLFKITPRQWYLMRYWPEFLYKKRKFSLTSCRRVPDVCSFYLLLLRESAINVGIFVDGSTAWNCETNSISLSTPYLEEKMPRLKKLSEDELLKNNDISVRLTQKDGDAFFGLLWHLLLTSLGAHDSSGVTLMKTMFPETSKENNPRPKKEIKEKPSVGVRVRVQLGTEGFPRQL